MADTYRIRTSACAHCGDVVNRQQRSSGPRIKYCDTKCAQASYRCKKAPDHYRCHHCGDAFTGRKRKYCNQACQDDAKRKADRGRKRQARKDKRCEKCGESVPINRMKYCSRQCARSVEADGRNFRVEWIRRVCARGECGPPTYDQWLIRKESSERYRAIHQAPRQHILERNAKDAWRHHIKIQASDEWCRRYYDALERPWGNPRLSSGDKWKARYQNDELFAMRERIRSAERKQKKRARTDELLRKAINKQERSRSIEVRLGYTLKDLKEHLAKQFTRGMTWEKFRAGEIHIDHIIPKSLFDISDDDEYRACWCLSNLRPMWAEDNIKKAARQVCLC